MTNQQVQEKTLNTKIKNSQQEEKRRWENLQDK
jgi:hypothetical protein